MPNKCQMYQTSNPACGDCLLQNFENLFCSEAQKKPESIRMIWEEFLNEFHIDECISFSKKQIDILARLDFAIRNNHIKE